MSDQQADIPKEPEGGGFGPLRALAECQLQIQFTLGSAYDTQAMGILGLDAALSAAAIAGDRLLGRYWWLALIGLLLSSCFCVWSLRTRADEPGPDIGPAISGAERLTSDEMSEAIAGAVGKSIRANAGRLKRKSELVSFASAVLASTVVATIIIVITF
jgi:hypothetical protein